jgi:hypothetical protein
MFGNRRNRANKLESSSLERQGFAILLEGSNFINIHKVVVSGLFNFSLITISQTGNKTPKLAS